MTFVPVPHVSDEQLVQTLWGNTVADNLDYLKANQDTLIARAGSGTTASRPASGTPGQLFYATDTKRQWQYDGTAWRVIGGAVPRVSMAGGSLNLASGAQGKMPFTNAQERYDTDGFHDGTAQPTRITIPAALAGVWSFGYTVDFGTGVGSRDTWLARNNVVAPGLYFAYMQVNATGTIATINNGCTDVVMAAGDYMELFVYQTSGASMNIGAAGVAEFWATYRGPA